MKISCVLLTSVFLLVATGGSLLRAGPALQAAPVRPDAALADREGGAPQTDASPSSRDERSAETLQDLDLRAAQVQDLSADFEQTKFTPLLRQPLVSRGLVRVAGSMMRWDTREPYPSSMLVTPRELRIYYPDQAVVEIYRIDEAMGQLAASPLPRLALLREHFDIQPAADGAGAEQGGPGAGAATQPADGVAPAVLPLRLLPRKAALREHVQEVTVRVDRQSGLARVVEMIDADGDRTVVTFANFKVNSALREQDLQLQLPAGTQETHPLAALEGEAQE